jgi:hypothetical protein
LGVLSHDLPIDAEYWHGFAEERALLPQRMKIFRRFGIYRVCVRIGLAREVDFCPVDVE